jgi:hypothetical protein
MSDYTKFLTIKTHLQRLYNFRAKEEREIIFAIKIEEQKIAKEEPLNITTDLSYRSTKTMAQVTLPDSNEIIALTAVKGIYYLEFLSVGKDICFNYSTSLSLLIKITQKNHEEISLKIAERNIDVKFYIENNLKEFIWCLIHLFPFIKTDSDIQVRGVNYKDLEEFAQKNKFSNFNKIYETDLKKEKYEVEVSDEELSILNYTLKSINVDSIINYDLQNLNSKIEQFNIETKESFLQTLQGSFSKDVNHFLNELGKLNNTLDTLKSSFDQDNDSIERIFQSIQKIEDANHRVELRGENKRKLTEYINKLLDQLIVSKSKEESLINCRYLYNSELVIVSEVLDRFVKFYKSRRRQDIKMIIIKEGHNRIMRLIELMNTSFNTRINENIKKNKFHETHLLRSLPHFNSQRLNKFISDNSAILNTERISLSDFILDRRFFIEKVNQLLDNQEDLKKDEIFKNCAVSVAKGLRDLLALEFNSLIKFWEILFESDLLNQEILDIYLDTDHLLKFDALEKMDSDFLFESNKYFSTIILNSFFAADSCVEILFNFFSEEPCFNIEKQTKYACEVEELVTSKLYDILSKNFGTSVNDSRVLIAFVIYSILFAVQDKITKNAIDDMVLLNLKDIFESADREDPNLTTNTFKDYVYEDVGVRKISLHETKNFIAKNIKLLSGFINKFLGDQKEIIANFNCEVRRVGIIPIVKKTINFLKLLIALTNGIKQDYIIEICEDFLSKLRITIERLSKIKAKYMNIILLENYYYIHKCFKSFENMNITNPKFATVEQSSFNIYLKYKEEYTKEITEYQFKEFLPYYEKLNYQFGSIGEQIKLQSGYVFNSFDKQMTVFMKELPKTLEKIARRVNKHFSKDEPLTPIIWKEEQKYLVSILNNIESLYSQCYGKQVNEGLLKTAKDAVIAYDIMPVYMKK